MARTRGNTSLEAAYITPRAIFYGYIMVSVIGIRWNIKSKVNAMLNDGLNNIVREYLVHTCQDDEWLKRQVLDVARDSTPSNLREIIRHELPTMFKKRRLKPLHVPDELEGEEVVFIPEFIYQLKDRVTSIKREIAMNEAENALAEDAVEGEDRTPNVQASVEPVVVNFFIPQGVDAGELTLENYRELTGKRFRMTKDQKDVRGLSRAAAFDESRTKAMSLANGGN